MHETKRSDGSEAAVPTQASLYSAVNAVFWQLTPSRRRSIIPLLLLMLAGALAELLNLGAILALLTMIADPARMSWFGNSGAAIGLESDWNSTDKIYVSALVFAIAILIAAAIRLLLLRATLRFVFGVAHDLGVRLYRDVLYQDYLYHTGRNSSEVIAGINKAQLVTEGLIMPLMQAAVATVLAAFIVIGLVWIDPFVALIAGVLLAAVYVVTSTISRSSLHRAGRLQAKAQETRVQAMQEGLGGIRDILIDRSQPIFIEVYERAEKELREARFSTQFAAQSPRFIVESLGMLVVAMVACVLTTGPGGR